MNRNENHLPINVWEAIQRQATISVAGQRYMQDFVVCDDSLDSLLGPIGFNYDGVAFRMLNETGE